MNDNYCYTSLLGSDNYLQGIFGLHYSLLLTKPKYPFIVIAVDSLSKATFLQLDKHKIKYIKVKDLASYKSDKERKANRYYCTVNKIYILNMPYDKVFFIDGDSIILHNIDYVFEQEPPKANMAGLYGSEDGIMGGYFLVKPNEKIFNSLYAQYPYPGTMVDVHLLNQYYHNSKWIELNHNNIFHNSGSIKYWEGEKLKTYKQVENYLNTIITALLQLEKYNIIEEWFFTGR